MLLEVLAGRTIDDTPGSFRVFEELRKRVEAGSGPQRVWNDVVRLHATVMGWFRSRDLYHKIGYLITVGRPLVELVQLGRILTKREFEVQLDDRIRLALNLTPSEAANLKVQELPTSSDVSRQERSKNT